MSDQASDPPRPARRLWRTWLKRPRPLRRFAPRIDFDPAAASHPELAEAAHWGQVVLVNDSLTVLHRDGTCSQLFHVVAMLHGPQELAAWDEVLRQYDARTSRFTNLRAELHLPNGERKRAAYRAGQFDAHVRVQQLAFHPLRPGVVVEFEEQFDEFTPREAGPGLWDFALLQGPVPMRRVRFTVAVARPFEAQFRCLHGADAPVETDVGEYRVLQWDVRDRPGIESHDWLPPPRDFVPLVDVSTLRTWKSVAKHHAKDIHAPALPSKEVQRLAAEIAADAKTPREKAAAVYRYVVRDVRSGRPPQETLVEASRDSGRTLEDLRGDCKDKSALLVDLLRVVDVPAKIALVLTRPQGTTEFLPGQRFDHAIVEVPLDGETLWLDAAQGPFTFGDLPPLDQGIRAVVLEPDGFRETRTPLAVPDAEGIERSGRGRIDADGTYRFETTATVRGERAATIRAAFLDRSTELRRREIVRFVANELPTAAIEDAEFLALDDLLQPVRFRYAATLRGWGRRVERLLLLRLPWSEPLSQWSLAGVATRDAPLAIPAPQATRERQEIELPPGFATYGLPLQFSADCEWAGYECRLFEEEGRLIAERRCEFRGGILPIARAEEFERFRDAALRADETDVVLVASDSRLAPAT